MNAETAIATTSVPPSVVRIRQMDEDTTAWDSFVTAHPDGTFFHRAGWCDVLENAFGHRTHYLYAERDGHIAGVLPLGEIRSRLFGNSLISTPFCVYGGVLATDERARDALLEEAKKLADDLGVDYLEMRGRAPIGDWPGKDLYVTFRKTIDPDPETNLKAIPKKQRAMVRKGINAGLVGEINNELSGFYRMYSESVRNLGTPVFSSRYFSTLRDVFREECEIMTVTHGGMPVASVMSFYFRDEVLPYYGGGTTEARSLKANDFMYWELMRRACERGVRVFDYGRSRVGTGSYRFKKHWGFEPEPLSYQYHLVNATQLPDLSPNNPKYRLLIGTWRRLPLWLSQRVGPSIARNLG